MSTPADMDEETKASSRRSQPRRKARTASRRYMDYEEEEEMASPTDEEIEQWADRERKRRETWLAGPTEAEKDAWAHRERWRRMAYPAYDPQQERLEREQIAQRAQRHAQLAMEGALAAMWNWPWRMWADLIIAGRDAEEGFNFPTRRRRIPFDDEENY
jgi:hypothetical protein